MTTSVTSTGAVSRYPLVDDLRAIDPGEVAADHARIGIQADFWALANSVHCPIGQEPGSAWLLLPRVNGDALSANAYHSITWEHESGSTVFVGYVLHRAILQGLDGDGQAPYLCEFRDKRQVLKLSCIDASYNVRRPSPCGDSTLAGYFEDTLNTGTPYTWQQMFAAIWGNLPAAVAGSAPTLAYVPTEDPENWEFTGISAWDAVGQVLEFLQSRIVLDPLTGTFTVVRLGAAQSGLTAALAAQRHRLMRDDTPRADLNLSIAPATVRFFFPKRFLSCGQWHDDYVAGGPLVDEFHTIDKTTGLTGAQAGTVLPYHTDHVAEIEDDGTTVSNATALGALADDLVAKLADRFNRTTERGFWQFSGIVTSIATGGEIHSVTWRDFGDSVGTVTEVRRDPGQGMVKGPAAKKRCGCGRKRIAVLTSQLDAMASATAAELAFNESNNLVYTGVTFTLWDWQMNVGESVPVGTKLEAELICDRWLAQNPYCLVSDTLPA